MKKLFKGNLKAFIGALIGLDIVTFGFIAWALSVATNTFLIFILTIVLALVSLDIGAALLALYKLMTNKQ